MEAESKPERVQLRQVKLIPKINYHPVWKGPIEGYAVNKIRQNLWRLQSAEIEFEDVYQEAYFVFFKCAKKYKSVVFTAKHFMALYKTALHNRIYDLAYRRTDKAAISGLTDSKVKWTSVSPVASIDWMSDMPSELAECIEKILATDDTYLRDKKGWLETNNDFFCRLCGYDSSTNLVEQLLFWLEGKKAKL